MRHSFRTLGLSIFIVLSFIVIGVGFMFGLDNPVPWIMIAILTILPYIHKRITDQQFISWSNDLSVGIEDMDHDHKRLINLVNNLQMAVLYPAGESYERKALKEVVDYTVYHFKSEEDLMQQYDYPDFDSHKQTHVDMIEKVSHFMEAYENNRDASIHELTIYLKNWLLEHIAGTDQQYCQHIKKHMAN